MKTANFATYGTKPWYAQIRKALKDSPTFTITIPSKLVLPNGCTIRQKIRLQETRAFLESLAVVYPAQVKIAN